MISSGLYMLTNLSFPKSTQRIRRSTNVRTLEPYAHNLETLATGFTGGKGKPMLVLVKVRRCTR